MFENIYREAEEKMKKTLEILSQEFLRIRTGRANPALLDGIKVDYYGTQVPLKQIASIGVPEPRTLVIQAWDKNVVPEIEKAIYKADLGLTPAVDGNIIRINLPPLTEERRRELVKLVSKLAEDSRVAIRNIRRDAIEKLKKMEKDKEISEDEMHMGQKKIQELTDNYIKKIDEILSKKEKEIMEG